MKMVPIDTASPRTRGLGVTRIDLLGLGLIALSPVLFALLSWNTGARSDGLQSLITAVSAPILAIELIVVAGAARCGFEPIRSIRAQPAWMQVALLALVLIAFATALFVAVNPALAMYRSIGNLFHLMFGLAAAHLIASRWSGLAPLIWPAVVAGTCLYAATVALFVASIADTEIFAWEYFGLGVSNIRQTGFHSAIGASAALGLASFAATRRSYWLWVAAASLMTALSFWSGTRTSLAAITASFALALLIVPRMRTGRAIGALLISFAAGAILSLVHVAPHPAFGMFRVVTSVAQATVDEVSSGRLWMWRDTLSVIAQRPFFGFGESQFRFVVPASLGAFNHPHNLVLQVLLQWGIVGGACFFALACAVWHRFHVLGRRMVPAAVPALLVANAMLAFSLVEGSFYHPYPIMMTALALAFVLSAREAADSAAARSDHRFSPAFPPAAEEASAPARATARRR